ncbi:MAG: CSLREA domain-containing protein, partial [Anaerolineales bacterium]
MNRSTMAHTLTRAIGLFVVATLLVPLVNVGAPPAEAYSATITVNTSDDELNNDNDCSLREAIQAANTNSVVDKCSAGQANPNLDTITFTAATNGKPIFLAGTAGEDANATGDLDILDGGDLTIQGNGATNTLIDGNGTDRVFHICPGGGCANTVTFKGVTIRNGSAGFGGGILNQGSTLNVQDSTIGGVGAGNTSSDEGGGIENQDGTTTLDGTTVSANRAEYGGGICNHATLNVQNGSTIGEAGAGNTAENGGGIHNFAGTTTVEASTVISNSATDGGGIY